MIILKNVRLAFPQLWEPHAESGKFNAIGIMEPGSEAHVLLEREIEKVMTEKWRGKVKIDQLRQFCLHDGSEKSQYDGFDGMVYISANNAARPTVVDRNGAPLTEASGRPYSGCRVAFYVDIWTQDNKYGKGVNATLLGVQFMKDDTPFSGGRPLAPDQFLSFEDEADEASSIFG